MNEYQNPQNCGSPNKYCGNSGISDVGNSYGNNNVESNAQSDIGFSQPQNTKRYVCRNCGTVHHGKTQKDTFAVTVVPYITAPISPVTVASVIAVILESRKS